MSCLTRTLSQAAVLGCALLSARPAPAGPLPSASGRITVVARVESPLGLLQTEPGDRSRNLLSAPDIGSLVVTIEAGSHLSIWPAGSVGAESIDLDAGFDRRFTIMDFSLLMPHLKTATDSLIITVISAGQ